jgi:hypothetical protein
MDHERVLRTPLLIKELNGGLSPSFSPLRL